MMQMKAYRFDKRRSIKVVVLVEGQQSWQIMKGVLADLEAWLAFHFYLVNDVVTYLIFLPMVKVETAKLVKSLQRN